MSNLDAALTRVGIGFGFAIAVAVVCTVVVLFIDWLAGGDR